jgi:hypothetical protein
MSLYTGGLTEGGRLEKSRRCGVYPAVSVSGTSNPACSPVSPVSPIQVKSAGMYTENLQNVCGLSTRRGVSQSRVAQILASALASNPSSEGVRIQHLQESYLPGAINGPPVGSAPVPIVLTVCPPLPAPPAPPARACVLAKNERF